MRPRRPAPPATSSPARAGPAPGPAVPPTGGGPASAVVTGSGGPVAPTGDDTTTADTEPAATGADIPAAPDAGTDAPAAGQDAPGSAGDTGTTGDPQPDAI